MKTILDRVKFPLLLKDVVELAGKKIALRIEIHEERALAFLDRDDDFFAEGKTIKEAKQSLIRGLKDELHFLHRHRDELSHELKNKYQLLQDILL